MSDFDKEAEREKLRERFEAEEEDRQHTQQLSELLLKGATMTNDHCDRCGDPIFRYDGQAFCPTCQSEEQAAGGDAQAGMQNRGAATNAERTASAEPTDPSEDSGSADAADASAGTDASEAANLGGAGRAARSQASPSPARSAAPTPAETPAATPESGDVAEAADALRATLAKFSQKAAEADDPRRAREYLAAAREAAEALDALPY